MKNIWKPYEESFIKAYPIEPLAQLVNMFPFPASAIKAKAAAMKLRKMGKLFSWNYNDELLLIKLYPNIKNIELAEKFGKTEAAISAAAFKLKLRKTLEFMRKHSEKGMFKKGNVSFNKGKKQSEYMSAEMIERTKSTRFKKGNIPHNSYNEVGKVVTRQNDGERPYQYICLALGKWVLYHRDVWEKANGKIPAGYCIWFKDGNSLNCEIENLELITRKENRLRNTGHQQLTPNYLASMIVGGYRKEDKDLSLKELVLQNEELLEAKKQQILLNRKIKSHGTKQIIRP